MFNSGFMIENPVAQEELNLPQDVIFDVLPQRELRPIREYLNQVCSAKARKSAFVRDRVKRGQRYFKPKPGAPKDKPLPKWKPNPNPELGQCTDFIIKHMPSHVACVCDPYNGRYRIIAPDSLEWKSISWSKRGFQKCSYLALHQAWAYEYQYFGTQCPFPWKDLARLAKEAEDAGIAELG